MLHIRYVDSLTLFAPTLAALCPNLAAAPVFKLRMSTNHLKWISLVTLVVQNSAMVILMKYSRTVHGPAYLASTAVVLAELTKLVICLTAHSLDLHKLHQLSISRLWNDLFGPKSQWLKIMVPAVLYLVQNNLQYFAVSLLDAATFQVTYQMKILTTAMFSVLMLNKVLSMTKWIALLILTGGIALVQLPAGTTVGGDKTSEDDWSRIAGLIGVAIACILSGVAGVWFEKVLKNSDASLWLRNTQLSVFSVIPGFLIGVCYMDGAAYRINGFFSGYSVWTIAAILCQALGGLIVAVVVKYADNILKGFATSLSIILSCLASVWLFDFQISASFLGGAALVLYATNMYGQPDKPVPVLPVATQSASYKLNEKNSSDSSAAILRSNKSI